MDYDIANLRRAGYDNAPSAALVLYAPTVTVPNIASFHTATISPNRRAWVVIGDRKATDLQTLAKYGKVVELRKADVYK